MLGVYVSNSDAIAKSVCLRAEARAPRAFPMPIGVTGRPPQKIPACRAVLNRDQPYARAKYIAY